MRRGRWTAAVLFMGLLYLTGCGKEPEAQQPEWTLVQETAAVLSNGERVELWHTDEDSYNVYRLSDGTDLLVVGGPNRLNSVTVPGGGFTALPPEAQQSIQMYFDEQGTLYNVQDELEAAYVGYQESLSKEQPWEARRIEQETRLVAESARMASFYTTLSLDGEPLQDYRLGAVFDRESGKKLDLWSLFAVSQETAMERLIEGGGVTDPGLYASLAAALQPERVVFFGDCVGVYFTKELLGNDEGYEFTVEYAALTDVLESWAVPDGALSENEQD